MNYYKNKNHEGVFTLWMNRARCGCETYFAQDVKDNPRTKAN